MEPSSWDARAQAELGGWARRVSACAVAAGMGDCGDLQYVAVDCAWFKAKVADQRPEFIPLPRFVRVSATLRLWRPRHIFQKSITISLAVVLFAQKFGICLSMTQSTAYVVHCTKATRGCPIKPSADGDSCGPRNPEKTIGQSAQRDDGRLTLIK
jgi:hypothetical protein